MRIGIDARIILNPTASNKSKVACYVDCLMRRLISKDQRNQYVLFFDSRINKKDTEKFRAPNVEIKYFPFSTYRHYLSYGYSQFIVSGFLSKQNLDVFHATAGTMPLTYSGPTILTLFKLEEKGVIGRAAQKKIAQKAKIVLVQHGSMKKELIDVYKVKEDRIIPLDKYDCDANTGECMNKECIDRHLEFYRVARNSDIKERYLLKLPLRAFATAARPIKKIVGPMGKAFTYPIKKVSKFRNSRRK